MTHLTQYLFNVILNSSFSFFAGFFIVFLSIKLFRIQASRWKLLIFLLPFIKIIWDLLLRGIPSSSIVHAGINPLMLPPKHQTLTIGGGFSQYGPIFNLVFGAQSLDGKSYSVSGADYLFALLSKYFGNFFPQLLLMALLLVTLMFILRRFWAVIAFEIKRKKNRIGDAMLETITLDFRKVDIYLSNHYEGTPFTGGIFKPYICFPQKTFQSLNKEERQAVVKHELAHIKTWDLLITIIIKIMGDFFWFIPGYRLLSRKIDRLREILADQLAIKMGALPEYLASALLKLKEIPVGFHHGILYSAFFREKSLLKTRIVSLLESNDSLKGRFGWNNKYIRILISAWIVGGVCMATFGGNHDVAVHEVPTWLMNFFKNLGFK